MGYTHYWELSRSEVVASAQNFGRLVTAVRPLFAKADELGITLWAEYDEPGTEPRFGEGVIAFNGAGDEGHETFYFDGTTATEWTFCKTALKPYDTVVCTFLLLAKDIYGPGLSVTSDGDWEGDWDEGRMLYATLTERDAESPF